MKKATSKQNIPQRSMFCLPISPILNTHLIATSLLHPQHLAGLIKKRATFCFHSPLFLFVFFNRFFTAQMVPYFYYVLYKSIALFLPYSSTFLPYLVFLRWTTCLTPTVIFEFIVCIRHSIHPGVIIGLEMRVVGLESSSCRFEII